MGRRMEIVFFTEGGYSGKVPRTHPNMRTEFALMCTLGAEHCPIGSSIPRSNYDLGIVLIPKKNVSHLIQSGFMDDSGYVQAVYFL